ncbi:LysE family transporter [Gordonia rubripertincta]|uniref:LysE family transporter n=2 Tax=Gordonia rubripertincta TaxID=36822 RepID=A0AAW6RG37_GORRU|nr:LysE family transporter [Gordonia rubripertincta]ASR05273.1 Arginine exporter protein ArgO [Gordonia rubripertincta]MDG6782224.1 LysE family transporter [Gordonia rubripertincta]NKY65038.1 LysE family transporter [Gordonia rubripertincta]QMU21551.1 LysE family transporter [Gordonia rubripertincta]GAB84790.1 putative amino acid transporter [Gordonia rubripertincta NBRC 101908]
MSSYLLPAIAGLLTGAGLIVAIGPQNVFVLRQGVARRHTGAIVAVCAISDVVLIVAGVAGLGAIVAAHPQVIAVAKLIGGLYVLVLGLLAARRCLRSNEAIAANAEEAESAGRWVAVGTALALTWLNPHVYLDTVLTMGAIANGHGNGKWAFAIGACLASVLWFTTLGGGARRLSHFFASPRAWKILDAVVAVIMIGMAVALFASV